MNLEEMSLSTYLKNMLTPQLITQIIKQIDDDKYPDNMTDTLERMYSRYVYLIKQGEEFKKIVELFADILIKITTIDFYYQFRKSGFNGYYDFIATEELDNLFYLFVGVCESNDIKISCVKQFLMEIVKATVEGKGTKNIIKEFTNKDCNQRPQQGDLPNVIRG